MTETLERRPDIIGFGGKGGGGGRVAKEAPDSLHSTQFAQILDAINVGPTGGLYSPEEMAMRDFFLNGTPIQNEDGTINWPGVEVHFRTGTQTQDPIPGFPGAEATYAVGYQVKMGSPWTQLITGSEHDAVRITLATDRLTEQNTKNGDLNGYYIDYAIDLQVSGGQWETVLTASMRGKTTARYTRTHRINLPLRSGPWSIRVRRTSPDSTGSHIASSLFVDTYGTVTDQRMRYPNIALVGYKIPAELFSSIPTRAVRAKGRIIRVPSNYNPATRTYSGTWDGSFKLAVSSNPAWVLLDIIVSDIFGLGQQIKLGMVDRWRLYTIARYCDELVPDGLGGMEPRFRAVGQIASREDAAKLLQDLATVFRGAAFAANGTVVVTADMPAQPVYTYSRANIRGKFQYAGSRRSTRYTVAQVSYSNMDDFGRQKVEPVENRKGLARYGVIETSMTAFMCVSRGQAHRLGAWTLLTSQEQTNAVKFRVAMDYAVVLPGSVIEIADNVLAGAMIGGRLAAAESRTLVVLDRRARVKPGDVLTINMPSGMCESQSVVGVEFLENLVRVQTSQFSEMPQAEAGWSVSADDLKPAPFRVVSVSHIGPMEVEITAQQEAVGKHEAVDYGTKLDPLPTTVFPGREMAVPANVRLVSNTSVDQGAASHTMRIEWDGSKDARAYSVQWRRDNSDWIALPDTSLESAEVPGIRAGTYQARVQAISALDVRSGWGVSEFTALQGTLEPPPILAYLRTVSRLYGIGLEWGFPETISPLRRTEIYWSPAPDFSQATLLSEVSFPTSQLELPGLKAGSEFWFWGRLVDSLGEKGDFFPISGDGVHGITITDPTEYLEAIKDEVLSSEVGRQLLADIENLNQSIAEIDAELATQGQAMSEQARKLIDLTEELRLEAVARSQGDQANAAAISAEATERKLQADANAAALGARVDALQAEVASLVGTPAWEDGKAYPAGVVVSWQGGLYRAKQEVPPGVEPDDTGYWDKIGNYDSLAEAVGDLTGRMAAVEVVTAGNVQKISQLEVVQGEQAASITDVQQVQAGHATRMATIESEQGEQASKIHSLETVTADTAQTLQNVVVQQGDMQSAISTLQTVTADMASRFDTLSTKVDGQESSISTLQTTQAGQAQRITTLEANQGDQASKIETIEDIQESQALRMTSLETKQGQDASKIQNLETTTANLASRTSSLETTQGEQGSSISTIQQTQASQATQINTLRTDVNGNASEISSLKTTTDGLVQQSNSMSTTIGQNTAAIRAEEQARVSADDALTLRINQTNTAVGQNTARIAQEEQARATEDAALSQRITRMEAGQLESFDTERAWNFDTSAEGWVPYGTNPGNDLTWVGESPYYIRNTQKPNAPSLLGRADSGYLPISERFDGKLNNIIRVRIRFRNKSVRQHLICYVAINNAASPGTQFLNVPINSESTDWQIVDFDLNEFPGGVPTATNISRIVIGDTRDSQNGPFDIDFVAVGRYGAPLSHALLQQEARARADADGALAQTVDTLRTATEAEDARLDAAVKSEAQARTSAVDAQAQRITQLKAEYNVQANGENLIRDPYWDAPQIHWSGSLANRFSKRTLPLNNQNDGNGYPFVASITASGGAANAFVGDLITRRDASENPGVFAGQPIEGGKTYTFSGKIALNNNDSVGVVQVRCQFFDANGDQVSDPILATADLSAQGVWPWSATFTAPGAAASFRFRYRFIYGPQGGDFRVTNMGLFATRMQLQSVSEASNAADIRTEQTARANADTALGQRIDTVTSRVGTVETSVATQANTLATLDGRVSSNWTVRVQANNAGRKYLAGIGVGIQSDGNGGTVDSYITMIADRLVLLTSVNGTLSSPFSVVNGQTFINDAFIRNASITTAKIGDAQITGAKIGNAQIWSGHIANAMIGNAHLVDAVISTAKIGVAQVDTLRIANGSVVGGASGGWNTEFGASGNQQVPIGNVPLYLPYGGTLLVFIQAKTAGGAWGQPGSPLGRFPTLIASINGNPLILNATPSGWKNPNGGDMNTIVDGFSYVYGPVGPGAYTLFMDVYRPANGTATYSVSAALLGFQR